MLLGFYNFKMNIMAVIFDPTQKQKKSTTGRALLLVLVCSCEYIVCA